MSGEALPPALRDSTTLALLEKPEDAKELYDKLEAAVRHFQHDAAEQNRYAEAKLRTARRGGELLAATVDGYRPHGIESRGETRLPDGISKSMSSRWQALARIPEDEWEAAIAHAKDTSGDELTLQRMLRKARELELGGRREIREAEAREQISGEPEIVEADVATWRPAGVDAIITDPPYVGDSIPLYEALRDFAVETLSDGAPLVVMTWQAILPSVIDALRHDELAYRWTICWRYASTENTADQKRRVFDCWKPVLVYHKGSWPTDARMFRDEIASAAPDKSFHEWGQSLDGFERLVASFTEPGDLVCDPFLGAGTTALAALSSARRFIGADVTSAAIETTRRRLDGR